MIAHIATGRTARCEVHRNGDLVEKLTLFMVISFFYFNVFLSLQFFSFFSLVLNLSSYLFYLTSLIDKLSTCLLFCHILVVRASDTTRLFKPKEVQYGSDPGDQTQPIDHCYDLLSVFIIF